MKTTRKVLSLFVVLCMVATMVAGMFTVSADGEAFTLTAPAGTVKVGDTVSIPVVLNKADGLTGFVLDITWDPAKLQMSATQAEAVELADFVSAMNPTVNMDLVNNGEVLISAAKATPISETGSVTLATLKFTALAAGAASVDFNEEDTNLSISTVETAVAKTGCAFTVADNTAAEEVVVWKVVGSAQETASSSAIKPVEGSLVRNGLQLATYGVTSAGTTQFAANTAASSALVVKHPEIENAIISNWGRLQANYRSSFKDGYLLTDGDVASVSYDIFLPSDQDPYAPRGFSLSIHQSENSAISSTDWTKTAKNSLGTVYLTFNNGEVYLSNSSGVKVPVGKPMPVKPDTWYTVTTKLYYRADSQLAYAVFVNEKDKAPVCIGTAATNPNTNNGNVCKNYIFIGDLAWYDNLVNETKDYPGNYTAYNNLTIKKEVPSTRPEAATDVYSLPAGEGVITSFTWPFTAAHAINNKITTGVKAGYIYPDKASTVYTTGQNGGFNIAGSGSSSANSKVNVSGVGEPVLPNTLKSNSTVMMWNYYRNLSDLISVEKNAIEYSYDIFIPNDANKNIERFSQISFGESKDKDDYKLTQNKRSIKVDILNGSASVANQSSSTLTLQEGSRSVPVNIGAWNTIRIVAALKNMGQSEYYAYCNGELLGTLVENSNTVTNFSNYGISQINFTQATTGADTEATTYYDNILVKMYKIDNEDHEFVIGGYEFEKTVRTDEDAKAFETAWAKEKVYYDEKGSLSKENLSSIEVNCFVPSDQLVPGTKNKGRGCDGHLYSFDVKVTYKNTTGEAINGNVIISIADASSGRYPLRGVYICPVTFAPTASGETATVKTTLNIKNIDHDITTGKHFWGHLKAYVVSDLNTFVPIGISSHNPYSLAITGNIAGLVWDKATTVE